MTDSRIRVLCCAAVSALALAGCGGTSLLPGHARPTAARQDGPAADPARVAVVKHWSAALQVGDVRAAAGFFHLPSVFANGSGDVIEIRSLADAEAADASLSCGARFISAFRQGRYVNVLFRLVARQGPGGGAAACGSGIGDTARTAFLIRHGQIVQWVRAASRPGDPGQPPPSTPSSPGQGGRIV